jgi:hypothetical protein
MQQEQSVDQDHQHRRAWDCFPMNPFKSLSTLIARKASAGDVVAPVATGQGHKVDWNAWADESMAKQRSPAVKTPRSMFGRVKSFARWAGIVLVAAFAGIFFSIAGGFWSILNEPRPETSPSSASYSPGPLAREATERSSRATLLLNREAARSIPDGPTNRDPNKPPGKRDDYTWVDTHTTKDNVKRDGYWRKKPGR